MDTKQKKIMFLGGIYYLKPAIEAAHKLGLWVITADYLPNNVAHQWSDEYINVSIIDKETVLKIAREKKIDGILSYAVDPGVMTAAYVAEQMGLPFACSYASTYILQNKDLFRAFLAENGFNVPFSCGYSEKTEVLDDVRNRLESGEWTMPVIVKPTDSAGSKGVTKVDSIDNIEMAIDDAFGKSISHHIIVEQFLEKVDFSSGSESFVLDGRVIFDGVYDQYFDPSSANIYTPAAEFWPSTQVTAIISDMHDQLQRLMSLLDVRTGLFNVEWRRCIDGKVYLMEVSPRAGGNRLAEVIRCASGIDLPAFNIATAIGAPLAIRDEIRPQYDGYWAGIVLHASCVGEFDYLWISDIMRDKVKDVTLYVKQGDRVGLFDGANSAIGSLFVRFESNKEMLEALSSQEQWVKVIIK